LQEVFLIPQHPEEKEKCNLPVDLRRRNRMYTQVRKQKGGQLMQRRCTQSDCRRVFRIGVSAPVRCPYCGTSYPRVQPDIRGSMIPFGYSVRADFTGISRPEFLEIRRTLLQQFYFPWYSVEEPVAIGEGFSQREAKILCQRFRQQGIRADVITTWDGQRQHLLFFRSLR